MTKEDVLKKFSKIAILGVSPKPERASYKVAKYLKDHNYTLCGVRPGGGSVLDFPVYENIGDVPDEFEVLDVFRASEHVPAIVDEALKKKTFQVIWLQEGVTHKEAEKKAKDSGLVVFSDVCIKKVHESLG